METQDQLELQSQKQRKGLGKVTVMLTLLRRDLNVAHVAQFLSISPNLLCTRGSTQVKSHSLVTPVGQDSLRDQH